MGVEVRRFLPEEWASYREIRLHALQADPQVFSSSHAREVGRTEAEWRARLAQPGSAVFGVFAGAELVGLTGVYVGEDPTVATLAASWLAPGWRRRGLSRLLYAARLAWAQGHPTVTRVQVSHRVGNEASRRANQAFGFVFTHTAPLAWPDGVVEDEVCYVLELPRGARRSVAAGRALER
jgi:RimJ/RimL family protein N-acetyltransferase